MTGGILVSGPTCHRVEYSRWPHHALSPVPRPRDYPPRLLFPLTSPLSLSPRQKILKKTKTLSKIPGGREKKRGRGKNSRRRDETLEEEIEEEKEALAGGDGGSGADPSGGGRGDGRSLLRRFVLAAVRNPNPSRG